MKISIIGAGNVGSSLAFTLAIKNFVNEIVLIDINESLAKAKSLDIKQSLSIFGSNTKTFGGSNYELTKNSDIVVITAGIARKPGMTREELISINGKITEQVVENIIKYNKNPIIVMVSNPLDITTYIAYKKSGLSKNRVFGMAGSLDIARYKVFLKEKINISINDIKAIILGGHGDDMLPLIRFTKVNGLNIENFLSEKDLKDVIKKTQNAGTEIVSLMGTSAYYAPAGGVFEIIKAIKNDEKSIISVSSFLEGEYGLNNICIGVPCIIGKNGIEKILELELLDEEKKQLEKSSQTIKETLNKFYS